MKLLTFMLLVSTLFGCIGGTKVGETPVVSEPVLPIAPIERAELSLVEFRIYDDPSGVRIYWSTEKEHNSVRFRVERSGNGTTWEELSTIAASINTDEITPYRLLDPTPFSGNNFYRVILEDYDGAEVVSEILSVKHLGYFELHIFPNPAPIGEQVNLSFEGQEHHEFQVELVDEFGARLQRKSFKSDLGINQLSFVPKAKKRGKYFVHVYLDDYPVQTFTLQLI